MSLTINRCLGKRPARSDVRTLMLRALMPTLPAPPPARDWTAKLPEDLGMYANDVLGDCTCASAAHLVQLWTAQVGLITNPTTAQVIAMYERFGYDPSDPSTDGGVAMLDVLNSWRQLGLGDSGDKIGAFAKVDHNDVDHLKAAIDYFGGLYVGVGLPISAQDTTRPWAGPSPLLPLSANQRPNSWGGHCMAVGAYDRESVTFLTWGRRQKADWSWVATYVDECYAIISPDWLDPHSGEAPVGLPIAKLNEYLSSL